MIERIPADLDNVKTLDVQKWFESFNWPVKWKEFLNLEISMQHVLERAVKQFPTHKNLIIINFKLYIEFANYLYALLLVSRTLGQLKVSEDNTYLQAILTSGIPDKPIITFPSLEVSVSPGRRWLQKLKRDLKDNRMRFFMFWKKRHSVLRESRSPHTLQYLKSQGTRTADLSFFDYYSKGSPKTPDQNTIQELREVADFITEEIKLSAESLDLQLERHQEQFVQEHCQKMLEKTWVALSCLRQGFGKTKPNLFIGNNSKFTSRLLSVLVLENGGYVHGFAHGEPMVYDWTLTSWMELSLCSHYSEYTDELARELAAMLRKHPAPNGNSCKIDSLEKREFDNIYKEERNKLPPKGSRVMLFGNRFRNTSYSSITAVFATLQLYYELKVISLLQDDGFEVVYKMHPDNKNIDLLKTLFPGNVEINARPFNAETTDVAAFAFYYTGTTTLGPALLSRKPILYFDFGISKPTSQLWEQFRKNVLFRKIE